MQLATSHKIIFSGPVGAGKTTAIASISDAAPLQTEAVATDETVQRKASTTVAMDYGVVALSNDTEVHLYGTPGQERFDFMWEILVEGGFGLVLLIDNARDDPISDLNSYLDVFQDFISGTGVAIGVTRMDLCRKPSLQEYAQTLRDRELIAPVFEVDAREPADIRSLLMALILLLDPMIGRHAIDTGLQT